MPVYEFEGKRPKIGAGCYIYETASIIGDVTIGEKCYIGPGAVVRGDYGTVKIGKRTAIEENVVVHARPGELCKIGSYVTLGHTSTIHNATLDDYCVIGMGAVVSDYAKIGKWAVIGEGAVVTNNTAVEPGKVAVGVPAKAVADVSEDYKLQWTQYKGLYSDLAERRLKMGLKRLKKY
ncbi:MAG: gamma carbonic anhydrase family protein [Candidatus Proteinoplasmatales archaeon SG8-5]|nr:MAG: gamma carbonic anhydrase family protein [Candidatus Proteinoplasmatales archaeon SG8-5]